MRENDVPQHNAKAFMGHSKVLYALDGQGRYVATSCSGWEAEEIVLDQAIDEFKQKAFNAWDRARQSRASTLEYHMYHQRMDPELLAQSTGFFKWRVHRHLKPDTFAKLPNRLKKRYAETLGLTPTQLVTLPEQP
ncbi:MAG: hypothetical protein ACYCS1_11375 [Gammaproteobacteria bacterium]